MSSLTLPDTPSRVHFVPSSEPIPEVAAPDQGPAQCEVRSMLHPRFSMLPLCAHPSWSEAEETSEGVPPPSSPEGRGKGGGDPELCTCDCDCVPYLSARGGHVDVAWDEPLVDSEPPTFGFPILPPPAIREEHEGLPADGPQPLFHTTREHAPVVVDMAPPENVLGSASCPWCGTIRTSVVAHVPVAPVPAATDAPGREGEFTPPQFGSAREDVPLEGHVALRSLGTISPPPHPATSAPVTPADTYPHQGARRRGAQ